MVDPPVDDSLGGTDGAQDGPNRDETMRETDPLLQLIQRMTAVEQQVAVRPAAPTGPSNALPPAFKAPAKFAGKKNEAPYREFICQFFAWVQALKLPREHWAVALLGLITGDAFTALSTRHPALMDRPPVLPTFEEMVASLESGSYASQETDFTIMTKLLRLRMKRLSDGTYDVTAHINAFDTLLMRRKVPMDEVTACFFLLESLPPALASRVASDPQGKTWTCLKDLRAFILAVADAWARESSADTSASAAAGPPNRSHKKVKFQTNVDHSGKQSFVPGKSPRELNSARKQGACFRCGQTGHKAAACPASK